MRINLSKSEIVPMDMVANAKEMISKLGYRVSSLPMKYLGMPLRDQFKARHNGDFILERMRKRLVK